MRAYPVMPLPQKVIENVGAVKEEPHNNASPSDKLSETDTSPLPERSDPMVFTTKLADRSGTYTYPF